MPPTAFPNADPLRQGRFGHCLCWGFRDGVVDPILLRQRPQSHC